MKAVEQARAVLERLERIEALRREDAPAGMLLGEVRALLAEAESWVDEEQAGPAARDALERSRAALAVGERTASAALTGR